MEGCAKTGGKKTRQVCETEKRFYIDTDPSCVYLDDDLTSRCGRHEWTYVFECPVISPRKMERDHRSHGERRYRYIEGPREKERHHLHTRNARMKSDVFARGALPYALV